MWCKARRLATLLAQWPTRDDTKVDERLHRVSVRQLRDERQAEQRAAVCEAELIVRKRARAT